MKPVTSQQIKDDAVYYTIRWSALQKADKYTIIKSVPELAGIFELYYLDPHKRIHLFYFTKAWYGGVRYGIKVRTDPTLERNRKRRAILEQYPIYYRYTLLDSMEDMEDILFFFAEDHFPQQTQFESSHRFNTIYVQEHSPDNIHDKG